MIKSIYLENWKTHLSSELEFKKGTNILLGQIGSGKSSIVDAICYSLYGTFPTLSNRKVTLDETIMFKPLKKEFFKVILKLEHNEKTYVIEREVFAGNKANSAKIYLDNKLIKGPKKTDVDEFISQLLGIDYNLFIKVVYSQQNEIDYFLKIMPSKRKEQFDDLFGISHFESIKINTREIDRLISIEIEKIELLLKQINSQIDSINIKEIKENEKDDDDKIIILKKDLSFENERINLLNNKIKEIRQIKEKYNLLNSEYQLNSSKIKDIEQELSNIKITNIPSVNDINLEKQEILEKEKEHIQKQNKNKEIEILKKSIEEKKIFYNNNFENINKKIKDLNSMLIKVEGNLINIEIIKKEILEKSNNLNISKNSLISKKNDLDKSINQLNKGFSTCPVCHTPFTKDKLEETKEHVKEEIKEINLKIEIIIKEINNNDEKIKEIEKTQEILLKNKEIINNIERLEKENIENKENLEKINQDILKIPAQIDLSNLENDINNKKEKIKLIEEYIRLNQKMKDLIEKNKLLDIKINENKYNEEEYLNLLAEQKNIDFRLKSIKETIENLERNIISLKKQIDMHNKLNYQKEKINKNQTKLNNKKQNISYFLKAIEISQSQLRKVLIDNVNQALSIIWPKIYPYKDYLSARLNANNDYILEVLTQKNDWIRVEGILSGGERACASLSIRIAISLILTKKLGLLILDEPTHNLDEKTIEALSIILDEEIPDLVDQIFIVTHDNKLLETLNANKYIIERDKEVDSTSKINI